VAKNRHERAMGASNSAHPKVMKWVAALAGVALLSSCASAAEAPNDQVAIPDALAGPVDLDFWHVYTGGDEEALNEVLAGFKKEYPDINVTSTFVGGYGQLRQKTVSAVRADTPPNVVISYETDALEYVRSDALVNLKDYRESPKHGLDDASWNDILEVERMRNTYASMNDANFSMPWTVADLVLAYNVDTLKKLGYSEPPKTWAEFSEICAAAEDQLGQKCLPASTDASTFHAVAMSFGGHALNSDGTAAGFDSSAWTSALQLYSDLAKAGQAFATTVGTGDTSTNDLAAFSSGSSPFVLRSSRLIPFIDKGVGNAFTWNAAALPQGAATEKPTTVLFGPNLSVFSTTPDEQLASWLLVKYLMSTEAQLTWSTKTGNLPIRVSTTELPEYAQELDGSQQLQTAVTVLPFAQTEGATGADGLLMPSLNEMRQMIEHAFESMLAGTSDVATAQATLQSSAQPLIDQANAEMKALSKNLGK
jgi:ABC-type glycerol-3-phosphate transport system substrate-binding protein